MFTTSLSAEILVFKNCTNEDYKFEKNEYKIDIDKGIMIRDFIYADETYERLRMNDMRIKKENTSTKKVARENGEIMTEISGYPAFYTQMIFDTFDKTIKLKSVLNNTEGISILSNCEKIIKYKLES
jgi:phage terminase large subunit